jgi:hypothetical protein
MSVAVLDERPILEPVAEPLLSKGSISKAAISLPEVCEPSAAGPLLTEEKPPVFKFDPPAYLPEEERKRMETEAREYERRCWVETGAPPKWDLLLRADPKFAAAVRAEAERIYRQAMAELTAYWARQAQLMREIEEEAKRRARQRFLSDLPAEAIRDSLECLSRFLSQKGDDATLRRLAESFRLANRIATVFRWPLIWNKETVRHSLKPLVQGLTEGRKGQIKTSKAEMLRALEDLIDIICNPKISPEDTRRALDEFLIKHTNGWPPPKNLMTKAIEFTTAKSLWLKRYRLFHPGADSTAHGQKIPDFVSPFGPGDNVRASGFNRPVGPNIFEPVLKPDPVRDLKSIENAYNSVVNDLKTKVAKYKDKGKVVVTIDATTAPWTDPKEIRARIIKEGIGGHLDAVYLLKGGCVERVWP